MRDADRGCPPRASPLADQTLRLGWLGGRPGTFDSVCRRVVLDIRGRVRTGVGVGWCFDEARPHARHKRAYESEHLGPGAEPAKHHDSSVRAAFRPVNPVPIRGPAVASPRGSSDWEPSVFETRASPISLCRKRSFATQQSVPEVGEAQTTSGPRCRSVPNGRHCASRALPTQSALRSAHAHRRCRTRLRLHRSERSFLRFAHAVESVAPRLER